MDACGEVHNAIDIDQGPLPVCTRVHFPDHMDMRGDLKPITLLSNGASDVIPSCKTNLRTNVWPTNPVAPVTKTFISRPPHTGPRFAG